MFVNLKDIRLKNQCTKKAMAEMLKLSRNGYLSYEQRNYLSAQKYYELNKNFPEDAPLPVDFFDYTPFILSVNMVIYGVTQTDIGKAIGKPQEYVCKLFKENRLMYDYKEGIDKIFPNIYIPCARDGEKGFIDIRNIRQVNS